MRWYKHIPNLLTSANLFLGCLALVFIFYDHITVQVSGETYFFNGHLVWDKLYLGKMPLAAWMVLLAVVIDFFDGAIARMLNATSELGRQLDSLADMITFGLVPAVMLYQLLGISLFNSTAAFKLGIILFLPAFLFTIAAALRLGKFNIDENQRDRYRGMPVPAAAISVLGIVLSVFRQEKYFSDWFTNPFYLYAAIILLSYLMISRFPVIKLSWNLRAYPGAKSALVFLLSAILISVFCWWQWQILFGLWPLLIIIYFIISSIILKKAS